MSQLSISTRFATSRLWLPHGSVFRHLVTRWLIIVHCCYDYPFKEVSRILIDVMMVMMIIMKMTLQKTAVFMLIYCGSGVAIKHFISTSVTVRNCTIYSVTQALYNIFALKRTPVTSHPVVSMVAIQVKFWVSRGYVETKELMSLSPDFVASIEFGRYKASIFIARLYLRKHFNRLFPKSLWSLSR